MHNSRSSSNYRSSSLVLLLLLASCAPGVEECRTLLPVLDGPVTVTQTPLGTTGCSCTTEEVVVMVEARRHYFEWERGQVWVDGTGVTMTEFSAKLDEAKAKHRAERMGVAIERGTRPVRKAVRDLGTTIKNLFK